MASVVLVLSVLLGADMNIVNRYLQIVEQMEATPDWTQAHDDLMDEADDLWQGMDDEQRQRILGMARYD